MFSYRRMRGVYYYKSMMRRVRSQWSGCLLAIAVCATPAVAHVFIPGIYRVGAYPPTPGIGWVGRAYLNLPPESAVNLIVAENYVDANGIEPDFTFRTDWIDFPAGQEVFRLDTEFETIGDLLDDYVHDVSDPALLEAPFGNVLLRFTGFVRVASRESNGADPRLPVWMEMATTAHDGFRTRIVETVYRLPTTQPGSASFRENAIIMGLGLFPIEITWLNRHDPTAMEPWRFAGIELYSWHQPGEPRPGNVTFEDPALGFPSLFPPYVIYQEADILPLMPGDFEADSDVDTVDFAALQDCFSGPGDEKPVFLDLGCEALDFDDDGDVDRHDHGGFVEAQTDPAG